jgi:hypothetical protein
MTEEWRPIPGFPDYFVSDQGRVASERTGERRILRGSVTGNGYLKVRLCRDGQATFRKVHHLVAEVFIGPRPVGQHVRHLDDMKTNNAAANLAHGTRSDNTLDSIRNGTHANSRKTECPKRHPYSDSNTYVTPTGRRMCRTCGRNRDTARAQRAAGIRAA